MVARGIGPRSARTSGQGLLLNALDENRGPAPSTAAFLVRTSLLLAGATFLSRILGLVREMLIANYYGSSGQTDAFFYALIIPELLRTLIISGAVASVFVPLMTTAQQDGTPEKARKLAGLMLSFISVLAIAVVIFGEFLAPALVSLSQVMSFASEPLDPQIHALTTELIRVFLPVILLVSLWGLMGGILNTFDNFHTPGFAPLVWNGTIIVLLLILGRYGDVHHIAWAFVIGHTIQVAYHIPALIRLGIFPVRIDWKHPLLLEFIRLAPAAVLAYAANAVNAFIGQGIALNLSESAASSLAYSFRIAQLPMAVFGVSVATAMFPTLSRHSAAGEDKEVVLTLARGIRMTALATLPAIVFFMTLPEESIRLLLERGQFTNQNTVDVAAALYCYSWAIMPVSILTLTARTFFSQKDTKTPAILGIFSIVVFYIVALVMSKYLSFLGIALANALIAWAILIISLVILQLRFRKHLSLMQAIGIRNINVLLIAGIIQGAVLTAYRDYFHDVSGTLNLLGFLLAGAAVGGFVFIGVLKLAKSDDLEATLRNILRKR